MHSIVRHTFAAALVAGLATAAASAANWTEGMSEGKPDIKSMNQLAFGPEGILFVADARSAAIFAVATGDNKAGASSAVKIEGVNEKAAALLGTSADQIIIDDLAVNPLSHTAYLAVSRGRGANSSSVLLRVKGGKLEAVSLDKVKFSKGVLPDAPADAPAPAEGKKGGGNPRQESITDIAFFEDRVLVAGLANEEFASTLRAIPFPFKTVPNGTGVEMYHGSHGRFETRSPVRTFVAFHAGKEPVLLAAYQCTPLVEVPISQLAPGAKVKGKTVAELGNRNRPIDMIVYQKGGKDYLLLANNSRGVMKISTDALDSSGAIESKVADKQGLNYETIAAWTGVDQLDQLDDKNAVVVRHAENGALNLESLPLP